MIKRLLAAALGALLAVPAVAATDVRTFDQTFSGTAAAAGVLPYSAPGPTNGIVDTIGFNATIYQVTTAGSGYTWTHQVSQDASTWKSASCVDSNGNAVTSGNGTTNAVVVCPASGRYFRLNVTGGTGTIAAIVSLKNLPSLAGGAPVTLSASTVTANLAALGTGGATVTRVVAANTTNATNLKASAATAYSVTIANNAATKVFAHLFNKATAPTCSGSPDTPLWSGAVDAVDGKSVTFDFGPVGLAFATGLGFCITTDATATTAVAASAAVVTVGWK